MKITKLITILLLLSTISCSSVSSQKDLLSESMDLYSRQLFDPAKESFTKFQSTKSNSAYISFAELKIADCEFFLGQYEKAITSYKNFVKLRPKSEAADYALLQTAKAYEAIYKSEVTDQSPLDNAIKNYNQIVVNYPNSLYLKHALESTTEIRNKLAMHEIKVAKYYAKKENFAAAKKRLEEVVINYAETRAAFSVAPIIAKEHGIVLSRETIVPNKKLDLIKSRALINNKKTLKSFF